MLTGAWGFDPNEEKIIRVWKKSGIKMSNIKLNIEFRLKLLINMLRFNIHNTVLPVHAYHSYVFICVKFSKAPSVLIYILLNPSARIHSTTNTGTAWHKELLRAQRPVIFSYSSWKNSQNQFYYFKKFEYQHNIKYFRYHFWQNILLVVSHVHLDSVLRGKAQILQMYEVQGT